VEDLCKNPESETARILLLEIARYAQCHFAYEETMMTVYDYPDRDQHVAQHAGILTALRRSIENDCVNLAQMRFQLLRWLMAHIPQEDKPMLAFVTAQRPCID
jgi:hemerythrin